MATDPYKYFRVEAQELLEGLTQGALELEKGAADRAMVGSLLRLAHTLKGAARVVRQPAVAELAHGGEDILSPFRDPGTPVPQDLAPEMLHLLDQIGAGLAALDHPSRDTAAPASRPASEEPLETGRVDGAGVEGVLGSLSEAAVLLRKMQNETVALHQARRLASQLVQRIDLSGDAPDGARLRGIRLLAEEVSSSIARVARRFGPEIDEAQSAISLTRECANRLRLLPAKSIFPALPRAVRDAAVTLGKQAEFTTSGGDIRLDARVLLTMRDAILQLVRNAVAHGLESPAVRAAAGKPACVRIHFGIERRGNRVAILCRDEWPRTPRCSRPRGQTGLRQHSFRHRAPREPGGVPLPGRWRRYRPGGDSPGGGEKGCGTAWRRGGYGISRSHRPDSAGRYHHRGEADGHLGAWHRPRHSTRIDGAPQRRNLGGNG